MSSRPRRAVAAQPLGNPIPPSDAAAAHGEAPADDGEEENKAPDERFNNQDDVRPAAADAADNPRNALCDLDREELRSDRYRLSDACPGCGNPVFQHLKAADRQHAAAAPRPAADHARSNGSDLLKAASNLKKWTSTTPVKTFLNNIESHLKLLSHIPTQDYNKVLPLLMDKPSDQEWVSKNIVEKHLSWEQSRANFTAYFRRSLYEVESWQHYLKPTQRSNDTVQSYANWYTSICEELGIDDNDRSAIQHWLSGLKPAIYREYERTKADRMVKALLEADDHKAGGAGAGAADANDMSNFVNVPSMLDEKSLRTVQRACVLIDIGLNTNSQRGRGDGRSDEGKKKHEHKKSKSDNQSSKSAGPGTGRSDNSKTCKFHPNTTKHSTEECRMNPKNKHSGSAPAREASPSPAVKREGNVPAHIKCFKCGGNHYPSDPKCPKYNQPRQQGNQAHVNRPQARVAEMVVDDDDEAVPEFEENRISVSDDIVTLANGHSLPAASLLPSKGRMDVLLSGTLYVDNLVDCGADLSVMDLNLAQRLGLKVVPQPGTLKLATGVVKPRYGCLAEPLEVTVLFPGDKDNRQPITVRHQFEVAPFHKDQYAFIIGKDMLYHVVFTDGIPPAYFPPPALARVPELVTRTAAPELSVAAIAVADDSPYVDGINELAQHVHDAGAGEMPAIEQPERPHVYTDESLEATYAKKRAVIMADKRIQEAIAKNGKVKGFCTIPGAVLVLEVDEEKKASLWRKPYPIRQALVEPCDLVIQRWLAAGKIGLAPANCPYNMPLCIAPKKDENGKLTGIRVCLDVRSLNAALKRTSVDHFQIPYIRRVLEYFAECTIFAELDLEEAYLQIELHPDSRPYTAFQWKGVQYMFHGVPFGPESVPSFFQRLVSTHVGRHVPCTQPYFDNFPIGSKTWQEHGEHLLMVLTRLTDSNLKVKPSSIKIGQSHMKCLGHILSGSGVGVDPDKVKAITEWPLPSTGAALQSFLGLAVFVRDHVRHFADITAPLEAIKQQKTLTWTDTLVEAFETTKRAIAAAPFLKFPDFSKPFVIATDASNAGIGGVLYQPTDADMTITPHNIVAICSKKLNECQQRYSTYKKELFAVVYCLRLFDTYVWGRRDLVIFTDHKPLTHMKESPALSQPLQQWLDVLNDYSFEIKHRPGILNVIPDALSRMFSSVYSGRPWGTGAILALSDAATSVVGEGPAIAGITISDADSPPSVDDRLDDMDIANLFSFSFDFAALTPDSADLAVELEKRGKVSPDAKSRDDMIEQEHAFGHFGREAIYKKLYERGFWWPKMRDDIQAAIAECDACARYTVVKRGFHPAQAITARGPGDHWQIDCSVHLPKTPDGYTTLLVMVDVYTGFVVLRPMKSTSATEVAYHLWQLCATFGLPKILQSDNGPEFTNAVLRALVKHLGIDHRHISAYNPRADGKVERSIGTVVMVIKKLLHGTNKHWDMYVSFAQFTVNIKISSLTGSTPFSLMFHRSPNALEDYSTVDIKDIPLDEWRKHQDQVLSLIYPAISERVAQSKSKMVATLDKIHNQLKEASLPTGSTVMLLDQRRTDKFEPKYLGPYQIKRRTRNGTYVLQYPDGDLLDRHIPADQLKLVSKSVRQIDRSKPAFEVERIREHRGKPGAYEYLVRWKGYGEDDDTWEPESSFLDHKTIQHYWKSAFKPDPVPKTAASVPAKRITRTTKRSAGDTSSM